MDWWVTRLTLQIGRALLEVPLTEGSEVEARIDDQGALKVVGAFSSMREFDATLNAIIGIPGIREITCVVGIAESPRVPEPWQRRWPHN